METALASRWRLLFIVVSVACLCISSFGAPEPATDWYRDTCLDSRGLVGVQEFALLPDPIRKAWRAFRAAPSASGYQALVRLAKMYETRSACTKLVFDAARKLNRVPALMESYYAQASKPKANRYEKLAFAYLQHVATQCEIKWKPKDPGFLAKSMKLADHATPAGDVEARFMVAEVYEGQDYVRAREIGEDILRRRPELYRTRVVVANYYSVGIVSLIKVNGVNELDFSSPGAPKREKKIAHLRKVIDQHPTFAPAYYYAAQGTGGDEQTRYLQKYLQYEKPEFAKSKMTTEARRLLADNAKRKEGK